MQHHLHKTSRNLAGQKYRRKFHRLILNVAITAVALKFQRKALKFSVWYAKSHWCYRSRDIFFWRWTFYATEMNAAISRSSFEWKMFVRSGEIRISSSFQTDVNLIFRQNITKTFHCTHLPYLLYINSNVIFWARISDITYKSASKNM